MAWYLGLLGSLRLAMVINCSKDTPSSSGDWVDDGTVSDPQTWGDPCIQLLNLNTLNACNVVNSICH